MYIVAWLRAGAASGVLFTATRASAHTVGDRADFNPWIPDVLTTLLLLATALIYWRGQRAGRARTSQQTRQQYWFWCGWMLLTVALAPPIDPLGNALFSVHMIQHELMMLGAAPLLVASRPSASLLRGLPRAAARAVGALLRVTGGSHWLAWLSMPLNAWFIHAAGLWAWHIPWLFNAGLRNDLVHTAQHISFLFIALVFWFALLKPRQKTPAVSVIYLFTTALHASILGALLTFSPQAWYSPYEISAPQWGFTALEDQQLGGLIMWMPAGTVFLVAALVCLAKVLSTVDPDPAASLQTVDSRNAHRERTHS